MQKKAYEATDGGSPSWVYGELKNIPWTPPISTSLDVLVLSHGKTTSIQRDTLVETMNEKGYRPLIFSELVALGILRPDLNKRKEYLTTYEKHSLDGNPRVPFLYWLGGERRLRANDVSLDWFERNRFLFVRK